MGLVLCERHGQRGLLPSCPHVEHAIHERATIGVHVAIDDWREPTLVCDVCHATIQEKRTFGNGAVAGFRHLLADHELANCAGCAADWYAEIGHGALNIAIEAARAAARVDVTSSSIH